MNKPYSIKIFMPGGDPDGLRTIEKTNWSGHGLVIPRTLFGDAKKREELKRAGVYVLIGPPEDSGLAQVYVGEGDPIGPRLEQHAAKKDFWITCIAFTSKDSNLNKAHVQYLESRLVSLATEAKRCILDNGNVPQLPSLSEADTADAEGFLSEMLLCFPVLGVGIFSRATVAAKSGPVLYLKGKGITAQGVLTAQGLVIRKGSGAVNSAVPSCHASMKELRNALVSNGVLKINGEHYTFTEDYVFSSPSTAADVALGRSANGRLEWKTKEGTPLKELQDKDLSG